MVYTGPLGPTDPYTGRGIDVGLTTGRRPVPESMGCKLPTQPRGLAMGYTAGPVPPVLVQHKPTRCLGPHCKNMITQGTFCCFDCEDWYKLLDKENDG